MGGIIMLSQRSFWQCCLSGWLLSLFVLAGCGQSLPVSREAAAIYVAADRDHLALITWHKSGSNELDGEWVSREMPDLQLLLQPKPVKTRWSGQIQDGGRTIALTVSGTVLQAEIEKQWLKMTGFNTAGYFQGPLWYRISQEQANQYSAAFDAYGQARLEFALLRQMVASLPSDSDPYGYARLVLSAEWYVQGLREQRDQVKRLGEGMCGSGVLAQFWQKYPPVAGQFVLSSQERAEKTAGENAQVTLEASTLWQQIERYTRAWAQAVGKPVPQVVGVSLAWRVSPEALEWRQGKQQRRVEEQAREQLAELNQSLVVNYHTMKSLKQEAERIGLEVEAQARARGCP
jgi:hypothetical protein